MEKNINNKIWEQLTLKKTKPMFFGLGFIQCKISSEERYHFYHPSLIPVVNIEEEIHDHRYDFVSTIIKGTLTNKIYDFKENINNTSINNLYIKTKESCDKNKEVMDDIKKYGNISLILESDYNEGQQYFMDNNTFHTVKAINCITHLKRSEYKKELANVIRPEKTVKICPFSIVIDEEKCWELIKEMLEIKT